VQVIPATSDSNIEDGAAITSVFNFLNRFNKSEPNAAGGAQNPSFYALLTAATQSEFDTVDAAPIVFAYVPDGNSIATPRLGNTRCNVRCFNFLIIPVCYNINCKT
jgi:hypothetical protein